MRAPRSLSIVVLVIGSGTSSGETPRDRPSLTLTARQANALSFEHSWTARLVDDELTVERPNEKPRVRRLGAHELDGLRRVLAQSRFDTIPERLGWTGICDDCARCAVVVEGDRRHRVERVADPEAEATTELSEPDRRFRAVWTAIKSSARVRAIPDTCW